MTKNSMTEIPEIKKYKAKQKARTNKQRNKQTKKIHKPDTLLLAHVVSTRL